MGGSTVLLFLFSFVTVISVSVPSIQLYTPPPPFLIKLTPRCFYIITAVPLMFLKRTTGG